MNKRIKELLNQSIVDIRDEYGNWLNFDVDQEKFAELIINECLELCDTHATIDGTAQQIRNSIKKYLGVKE